MTLSQRYSTRARCNGKKKTTVKYVSSMSRRWASEDITVDAVEEQPAASVPTINGHSAGATKRHSIGYATTVTPRCRTQSWRRI